MRRNRGKLIVVSGPSGAGKSTVIGKVMQSRPDLRFSVSATTRVPREGEVDGVDYYFLDREKFQAMICNGELLEYAEYVGNFYGTPVGPVKENLDQGNSVILDIEVQGAANVRKVMPEAVTVFLTPPNFEMLEMRLRSRDKETEEMILGRLARARVEYQEISRYDYIVINEDADEAAEELRAIILAEQCRTADRITLLKD